MDHGEYILVSSGRKGTFLILTALASHGEVRVYQQVLNDRGFYRRESGAEVIGRIFGAPPARVRATILPVAWASARNHYPGFWEGVRARRVSVIHLHRRNMLRWHVSRLLAEQVGIWIATKEVDQARPPIFVDPRECLGRILLDRRQERQARRFFSGCRAMDLWYEDLVRDFDRQMESVQRFLGVTPRKLRPTCVKQENRLLREAIGNYEELRRAWSGTRWEAFLDDVAEQGVGAADY